MVVPLVTIPWSNESLLGDFDAIFYVRLYLDHNMRYWSKLWTQVHALVKLENGAARKLREGPLKDRHGRPHRQCFGFGPISVCGQKTIIEASINLKSLTKHLKGLFVMIMGRVSLQR